MSELDLAPIKARADAATVGPWIVDEDQVRREPYRYPGHGPWEGRLPQYVTERYGILNENDAEFIAHAREDVPALVAEVERLRGELADAREMNRAWKRWVYEQQQELRVVKKEKIARLERELDAARQTIESHTCGANVELAYQRTIAAERERDELRAVITEADYFLIRAQVRKSWREDGWEVPEIDVQSARDALSRVPVDVLRERDAEKREYPRCLNCDEYIVAGQLKAHYVGRGDAHQDCKNPYRKGADAPTRVGASPVIPSPGAVELEGDTDE